MYENSVEAEMDEAVVQLAAAARQVSNCGMKALLELTKLYCSGGHLGEFDRISCTVMNGAVVDVGM